MFSHFDDHMLGVIQKIKIIIIVERTHIHIFKWSRRITYHMLKNIWS